MSGLLAPCEMKSMTNKTDKDEARENGDSVPSWVPGTVPGAGNIRRMFGSLNPGSHRSMGGKFTDDNNDSKIYDQCYLARAGCLLCHRLCDKCLILWNLHDQPWRTIITFILPIRKLRLRIMKRVSKGQKLVNGKYQIKNI